MGLFADEKTLENKVKAKLVYDAQKQKSHSKATANNDRLKDLQKKLADKQWAVVAKKYENAKNQAVDDIAQKKFANWKELNNIRRKFRTVKVEGESPSKTAEKQAAVEMDLLKQEADDITKILKSFDEDVAEYKTSAEKLRPKVADGIDVQTEEQSVLTLADDKFASLKKDFMDQAKALAKLKVETQHLKFQDDMVKRQLADIPLKIEETIDKVKTQLDTLLGKTLSPILTPESPDFDIDALIGQIKLFLTPVVSSTAPLASVVGQVPVLGSIAGMLGMASSAAGPSKLSKEEIKKLIPQKPSLDPQLVDKISGIMNDVWAFIVTLPTILIQVVFAMIDLIYSKLRIITSVVPLGGMFPLNLVPMAIEAVPKILAFIKVFPGMMWDMMKGLLMDKMAEAMALAIPKPSLDAESLNTMVEMINEDQPTRKSVAKPRKDYKDVTYEIYSGQLSAHGYTLLQAETVQSNYKKIHNSTKGNEKTIKKFVDDGQQRLPNVTGQSLAVNLERSGKGLANIALESTNLVTNAVSLGHGTDIEHIATDDTDKDESDVKAGFKVEDMTRRVPSPEDYEKTFKEFIANSDLSAGLKFDRIRTMQSVVGELYETYKPQLSSYGRKVVMEDELVPGYWGNLGKSIGKSLDL